MTSNMKLEQYNMYLQDVCQATAMAVLEVKGKVDQVAAVKQAQPDSAEAFKRGATLEQLQNNSQLLAKAQQKLVALEQSFVLGHSNASSASVGPGGSQSEVGKERE